MANSEIKPKHIIFFSVFSCDNNLHFICLLEITSYDVHDDKINVILKIIFSAKTTS